MRNRSEAAVAILATAVLFGGGAVLAAMSAVEPHVIPGAGAALRTHVVEIREFRFEPSDLVVSAGDTIRWINSDPVPHTATARDSTWDSGRIAAGGDWQMVATADGTPGYFCIYHPIMTATVSVRRGPGG